MASSLRAIQDFAGAALMFTAMAFIVFTALVTVGMLVAASLIDMAIKQMAERF